MTPLGHAPAERTTPPVSVAPPRLMRMLLGAIANRSRRRAPWRTSPSAHLEAIVSAFFLGYSAALDALDDGDLGARLAGLAAGLRGFGYEGAAMALGLLDRLLPLHPARLRRFIDGTADPHIYMAHVGTGWAAARLRRPLVSARRGLDPVIDWLAVDGYGFHEGYFRTERVVRRAVPPHTTSVYAARAFDQGVGRSLWFVDAADPDRIAHSIHQFDAIRRSDLWSGVGLAAAYAGGVSAGDLRSLKVRAATHTPSLAQGAAFAAEARARAGNPAPHTEEACLIFAGTTAEQAAALVRRCRAGLQDAPDRPAYEQWRQRVALALMEEDT